MEKHFYTTSYFINESKDYASFEEMNELLKNNEIDKEIAQAITLIDLFRNGDNAIKGSQNLLEAFRKVDCEKLDVTCPLSNMEYIKFEMANDKDEIILRFNDENILATGTYDFTNKFLDDLFRMKKFARFCLSKGYIDILDNDIKKLFKRLNKTEKQYRFIKHDGKWFIRTLTSNRYKNYDNHLIVYLTLVFLDKYSRDKEIQMIVDNSFITDSDIKIMILEENVIDINDEIKLQFGYFASNNELTEGKFELKLRYKVINNENKKFKALSSAIFDVNHLTSIDKFVKEFDEVKELTKSKNEIIEYVKVINEEELSENQIYNVFKKLTHSSVKIKAETRSKIEQVRDNLVQSTLNLVDLFDKLDDLTTDVHEKVYLEKIFHDLIKEQKNTKKGKTNVV